MRKPTVQYRVPVRVYLEELGVQGSTGTGGYITGTGPRDGYTPSTPIPYRYQQ